MQIANSHISQASPCYIIAEAGVNHNGDVGLAHRLVDEAKDSGADAIKFQSFITENLILPNAPKADYQMSSTDASESQYSMLKSLEISFDALTALKEHCDAVGIAFICTPYDRESIDFLYSIKASAIKIASADMINLPLLEHLRPQENMPLILSTGLCSLWEVDYVLNALFGGKNPSNTALLHCTTEYPAPIEEANLRAIPTLASALKLPVGFSDHTPGFEASMVAVSIGAVILEKHFTLDTKMRGPDHQASLDPKGFRRFVETVRLTEKMLGDGVKKPVQSELKNKHRMQRSLVTLKPVIEGETLTKEHLTSKRPGTGVSPLYYFNILGKKAKKNIDSEVQISFNDVDWSGRSDE